MRSLTMRSLVPAAVLSAAAFAAGCDTTPGPSLYDPIETGQYAPAAPDPVVTSVTPDPGSPMIGSSYVAGLTTVTLSGTNFKPNNDSTFLYVAGERVMPISITPTQIRFRIPDTIGDGLTVRVMVLGATNFGSPAPFSIKSAFTRWGEIGAANILFSLATDVATQTGYVSMSEAGVNQGFVRQTGPAKGTTAVATTTTPPEIAYHDGFIYIVNNVRAVLRFAVPAPGAPPTPQSQQQTWQALTDTGLGLRAIDIEPNGTVWTGGVSTNAAQRGFYRITQAKVVTRTPFDGEVTAIEKAGSKLYVAGVRGGTRGIWRYDVAADGTVSGETQVVAFTGDYAAIIVNMLAVTAGGDVIAGTNNTAEPVLRVTAAGEISSLYPGLLSGTVSSMRWISNTQLLIAGPRIVSDLTGSMRTTGDLIVAEAFTTAQL